MSLERTNNWPAWPGQSSKVSRHGSGDSGYHLGNSFTGVNDDWRCDILYMGADVSSDVNMCISVWIGVSVLAGVCVCVILGRKKRVFRAE